MSNNKEVAQTLTWDLMLETSARAKAAGAKAGVTLMVMCGLNV